MDLAVIALFAAVVLAYAGLAVAYAREFAFPREAAGPRWSRGERPATLLLHVLFLLALGWSYRGFPLVSVWNFLTLLALGLAVVYSILEFRFSTHGTGVFFFALALLCHLASWPGLQPPAGLNPLLRDPLFGVHAAVALVGYVGCLVSALCGLFYLAMYRALKARRPSRLMERMPPLDLLATMTLHAAVLGFVCITGAIVLGAALAYHLKQPFLSDAKFIQTFFAWLLYGALLAGSYGLNWPGRTRARASALVFVLLIVSAFAVRWLIPTFHRFG